MIKTTGTNAEESKEAASGAPEESKKVPSIDLSKVKQQTPDYTTQGELDAFEQTVQLDKEYEKVLDCQVGLSCQDFFEAFHGDSATQPLDKFYISQGATNVSCSPWREPIADEKSHNGMTVSKIRDIAAEFKVDSAFVKSAPTVKTYRVIEDSATCIRIHCTNRTRDIPYCDTFDVIDILTVHMLNPKSKCCIVQIGLTYIWHKSTMMKSMIKKSAITEARSMNVLYKNILSQFPFVEQVKPAP